MINSAHLRPILSASLCFGLAGALLVEKYMPADITGHWYWSAGIVLLILVGVGFLIPLQRSNPPTEADLARYLLVLVYTTACLTIAVFLWAHHPPDPLETDLTWQFFSSRWLAIGGFLLAAWLIPIFAQTPRGQRILEHKAVQGLTWVWVSLLLFGCVAEAIIRHNTIRQEFIGAYPYIAAPEHQQPRQQWGLDDSAFPREKPEGVFRVLLIGDSFTYGYSVFEDERFAHYLQELAPENVQFIVLAYSGASTADQLTMWNNYGVVVQADIVIINAVANDTDMGYVMPLGIGIQDNLFTPLFPKSQFAYFLDALNLPMRLKGEGQNLMRGRWEEVMYNDPQTQAAWVPTVQTLHDNIVGSGAQAWVYILTEPFQADDPEIFAMWAATYTRMETVYTAAGFRTVNTWQPYLDAYQNRPYKDLCALPNDCHPSPELHRFFAELMWADLETALENLQAQP